MKDESSPSLAKQLVALQEQLRIEFELAQIAEGKTLFPHCGTCTQADAPLQRGKLTEVVRAMLTSLDFDVSQIASHSVNIGGMSAADARGQIFDRMSLRGRLRSVAAARKYVSESVSKALEVSRALNAAVADPGSVPDRAVPSAAAVAKNKRRRELL